MNKHFFHPDGPLSLSVCERAERSLRVDLDTVSLLNFHMPISGSINRSLLDLERNDAAIIVSLEGETKVTHFGSHAELQVGDFTITKASGSLSLTPLTTSGSRIGVVSLREGVLSGIVPNIDDFYGK